MRDFLSRELPISWRLPILTFLIFFAHALGLAWALGAGWVEDRVRMEILADVTEIRNQCRAAWRAFELVQTAQGRHELRVAAELRKTSERPQIVIIREGPGDGT